MAIPNALMLSDIITRLQGVIDKEGDMPAMIINGEEIAYPLTGESLTPQGGGSLQLLCGSSKACPAYEGSYEFYVDDEMVREMVKDEEVEEDQVFKAYLFARKFE